MRGEERISEQSRIKHLPAAPLLERRRLHRFKRDLLLLAALLLIGTLIAFAIADQLTPLHEPGNDSAMTNAAQQAFVVVHGHFLEYLLPQQDSEVMPPVIDHEGRLWFGEMGQNTLAVFDPRDRSFQQITPPHGHFSIMGVQIAADDTVWFAEQDANYIGHYFPRTRRFQLYPLPEIRQPNPDDAGKFLLQASEPNELSFDRHGNLWFTEVNANALGWLDTRSGQMRHYPLTQSHSGQNQKLAPFGLTLDPEGDIWFTEANSDQFGRFDPSTDQMRFFSWPGSHTPFKEIASDRQGRLYLTTFTSNLLLSFDPRTSIFTPFSAPSPSNHTDSGYGLPGMTMASSGDVWVADPASNALLRLDALTRRFTVYPIPTPASLPLSIIMGSNRVLWFTEVHKIGMLQP